MIALGQGVGRGEIIIWWQLLPGLGHSVVRSLGTVRGVGWGVNRTLSNVVALLEHCVQIW